MGRRYRRHRQYRNYDYKHSNHKGTAITVISVVFLLLLFGTLAYGVYISFTVDMSQTEKYIFQYINEERTSRGLPALGNDTSLCTIAKSWSANMIETKELTHGDFDGRANSIGLPNAQFSTGEVIAYFGGDFVNLPNANLPSDYARKFVDMWLNSPPHREIMLTAKTGSMGVGTSNNLLAFYGTVDFKFG